MTQKTALIAFGITLILALLTNGLDLILYPVAFVLLGITLVLGMLGR